MFRQLGEEVANEAERKEGGGLDCALVNWGSRLSVGGGGCQILLRNCKFENIKKNYIVESCFKMCTLNNTS